MNGARNPQNPLLQSRKFYGRLAIVCLFALTLLHGINSFFFTFFFWLSVGALVMVLYYHIVFTRTLGSSNQGGYSKPKPRQSRQQSATSPAMPSESKRFILLVGLSILGFFVLTTIIALFFGNESPASELESQPAIESEKYQEAFNQYDQKNFRDAITILKPDLLSGVSDSQSMLLLGDCYYEEKILDSAYIWYAKAYDLGARGANLSHLMAYILDEQGNTTDAIIFYKEALGQDSARVDIYRRLAELEPEKSDWYLGKQKQFE